MTAEREARRQLVLGLSATALVAIVAVVVGLVSYVPFGARSYRADLSEAQSVRVGDDVRIAGISVGEVRALELHRDRVSMVFTVDRAVFVGDTTSLDVRMLTIVGGNYIAVSPSGSDELVGTIPAERVHLPYSLLRTLQDATQPVAEVSGDDLKQNFAALDASIDATPDGLRRVGRALDSVVGILKRQNDDVSKALEVADEYLRALDDNTALIGEIVRKLGSLETVALAKRGEIHYALAVTAELLSRFAAVEPSWREILEPLADKVALSIPELQQLGREVDILIRSVGDMNTRLRGSMSDDGTLVLDHSASTVCVPTLGVVC